MEKQEKIIRQFIIELEKGQREFPKELPPRDGEKYLFKKQMTGYDEKSYYEIFQMGDCLYFTGVQEISHQHDELTTLQLINWLNGWSHYGIFSLHSSNNYILYEQTHFCRFFEYTIAEITDFYNQMLRRTSMYTLSADLVFNKKIKIEEAVDMATKTIGAIHN